MYIGYLINKQCKLTLAISLTLILTGFTMKERRKSIRKTTDHEIEFKVTETQFRQRKKVLSKGKIVDVSEHGFGMVTHYPLEKGQVITIKSNGQQKLPAFGMVQWTDHDNGVCKAGFGFKFHGNIEEF
jgi:hypothetical protein